MSGVDIVTGDIPFEVRAVQHKGFEDYCVVADGLEREFPDAFTIFGRGPSPRFVSKYRHSGTYNRPQDAATAFARFLGGRMQCAYRLQKVSDTDWVFHGCKNL